jgi:hypothetical protein
VGWHEFGRIPRHRGAGEQADDIWATPWADTARNVSQQMFGRAGRPQFDDSGTAVVRGRLRLSILNTLKDVFLFAQVMCEQSQEHKVGPRSCFGDQSMRSKLVISSLSVQGSFVHFNHTGKLSS